MEIDDRAFMAVLAIVLILGTLSAYIVVSAIGGNDPYDTVHEYMVEADLDDVKYEGFGESVYASESKLYRTYQFSISMTRATGDAERLSFGIVFNLDDEPDGTIFTKIGHEEIDDRVLSVWTVSYGGSSYTYHIGEMCTVEKVEIVSDRGTVTAILTD